MPNYEPQIEALVKQYKRAVEQIQTELERMDISTLSRANSLSALSSVSNILGALNSNSDEWVADNIPLAIREGIAETLVSLGAAKTVEEALKLAKFNRVNAELVKAVVSDTQADLLAVTQNIDKRVRSTVRQVTAEVLRDNLSKGINGRKTMNRQTLEGLRKKLGDSVNTGIIDASGRRWKPQVYVDMVTRTKMMRATNEATINEAIGRDAYYAKISSHGAKDACRNWEGRIVKIASEAPGDYPYIGDIPNRELFHPNCKHTISPVRVPDELRNSSKPVEKSDNINNMKNPTSEKEITKLGGKVAKGDNVLSKVYGTSDDDAIETNFSKSANSFFKGKYRGSGTALYDLRMSWVEDNTTSHSVALENYFSAKHNLPYSIKNKKKLSEREMAAVDFMQDETIKKFKEAGITHVKVYRGVSWDSKNNWLPNDTEDMHLTGRGLTSWTMRKGVAKEYADYVDDDATMGDTKGIIEAIVPIEQIGFTAIVGDTDEVVIVGDIKGAKVIKSQKRGGKW